jgi:hypothetical protein
MARSIRYTIRFTPDEEYAFRKRHTESGIYSISDFIRQAVLTAQVKPPPSPELVALLREVRAIGNNINQIVRVANASGLITKDEIGKMLAQQKELLARVKEL